MPPEPASAGDAADGPAPRTLGRYVVLYELHRGAEAAIYAAYDPELARKVAIKLLSAARSADPRHRPAPAHVVHPNLLTVHDVGTVGERVFVAMEFIAGTPLSAWLTEPRPARAVVQLFLGAGVGLQAAHAQGLAHRGFTADAVLLDADGRARVLGLYRPADAAALAAAVDADRGALVAALRRALAPPGDAAGWLPGVPAHVRRTLQRGSAPGVGLEGVLRALREAPRVRWARIALACALAAAVLVPLLIHARRQRELCRAAGAQVTQLFGPARAQTIRSAFQKTGKPYAETAFAAVQRSLGDYLPRLAARSQTSCEEARQRQPELARDLQRACLLQQRARIEHLLTLLTTADALIVQKTVSLLQQATDRGELARCDAAAGLRAATPPADGETAATVAALRQDLDRVSTLRLAGRLDDALRLARQSSTRALALPYRPLHAEALYAEGLVENALGHYAASDALLRRAVLLADASHHDRVLAQGWLRLFFSDAFQNVRLAEAHQDARHAAAALERCPDCADLWTWWHDYQGDLLLREAHVREALAHYQESFAQRQKQFPPDDFMLTHSYSNLGSAYAMLGQHGESLAAHRRALALTEKALGPDHPSTAAALAGLARTLQDVGRRDEALAAQERALAIYERAYGPSHIHVGSVLGEMGSLLIDMERLDAARARLERAVRILQHDLGPRSPRVAAALYLLGQVALRRAAYAEALPPLQAALSIREATLPADHVERGFSLAGVGRALIGLGRTAEARPLLQRALAIAEGADDEAKAQALPEAWFALALLRWHDPATRREALALADRARAAYLALGDGFKTERGEVEAWLHRHRPPR